MIEYKNPRYNSLGTIDCEINHSIHGWIPFTVNPDDTGADFDVSSLHNEIVSNGNISEYVPPTPTTEQLLKTAKKERDSNKHSPLDIILSAGPVSIDLDRDSQKNISETIEAFESARQVFLGLGWPDDGTIPWTMADNTEVAVTLQDLIAVRKAAVARGAQLHAEYNAYKQSLSV